MARVLGTGNERSEFHRRLRSAKWNTFQEVESWRQHGGCKHRLSEYVRRHQPPRRTDPRLGSRNRFLLFLIEIEIEMQSTITTMSISILGNCRWSLIGHAAAVDTLNLDADGWNLLSWDSQDNDRSLRLWNLANGLFVCNIFFT